jgi:hypothetical protein
MNYFVVRLMMFFAHEQNGGKGLVLIVLFSVGLLTLTRQW